MYICTIHVWKMIETDSFCFRCIQKNGYTIGKLYCVIFTLTPIVIPSKLLSVYCIILYINTRIKKYVKWILRTKTENRIQQKKLFRCDVRERLAGDEIMYCKKTEKNTKRMVSRRWIAFEGHFAFGIKCRRLIKNLTKLWFKNSTIVISKKELNKKRVLRSKKKEKK